MDDVLQSFRKLRAVVRRQGVAAQDADDIVQEAFARLEAYARRQELRSEEAFLVTTAVNFGRDQARRRQRTRIHVVSDEFDLDLVPDGAPLPEQQLAAQERLRRAESGLAQLNPTTRRCLLAKRIDGLTYPQIASREKLSVAAVEKRVARAVLFLTQWMGNG